MSLAIHLFSAVYVQSKGLLLATLLSYCFTLLVYSGVKIKLGNIIKAGLVLLIPFYLVFSSEYIDLSDFEREITGLLSNDTQSSNSASERLSFVVMSWEYFLDNPFVGIGTNNFANIEEKATHNNYLQILSENGLVGFVVFIILLFKLHKYFLTRKNKKNNSSYLLAVNSLWALTVYLFVINGFFNAITVIVLSIIIYFEKNTRSTRICVGQNLIR